MNEIVSAEWLYQNLDDKNLILLDVSLESTVGGNGSNYLNVTIKGARAFDLKSNFVNNKSQFPNTLPSGEQFERESKKLGINKSSRIIVFDNSGIYSSPRVWWMYKVMGHEKVSVLNGGLPEWIKKGLPTENKKTENYKLGDFKASFNKKLVLSYKDILDNLDTESYSVIDARSEGRFLGIEKEPRRHLKSGHISKSINIPYKQVLENGKFKTEKELKRIFERKCINAKKNGI